MGLSKLFSRCRNAETSLEHIGWWLSTQLLSGLVQGISALGSRDGFIASTRECLRATLPVSCTVV